MTKKASAMISNSSTAIKERLLYSIKSMIKRVQHHTGTMRAATGIFFMPLTPVKEIHASYSSTRPANIARILSTRLFLSAIRRTTPPPNRDTAAIKPKMPQSIFLVGSALKVLFLSARLRHQPMMYSSTAQPASVRLQAVELRTKPVPFTLNMVSQTLMMPPINSSSRAGIQSFFNFIGQHSFFDSIWMRIGSDMAVGCGITDIPYVIRQDRYRLPMGV